MNRDRLEKALSDYNIPYSNESIDNLINFSNQLINYNNIHNLTAITDENGIVYKHFIDSLLFYKEFNEKDKIIDIGCGAGFPSIPLSIINKNLHITAVDSTRKKTDFVNIIKNSLNLSNLDIITARIEDIAHNITHRGKYDKVISRAVAPLNTIIEYSSPLLNIGGKIIAYKGSNYQEEINTAKNALNILKCKVVDIKKHQVSEIEADRVAIIIEKVGEIGDKYPRNQNKPRINPL